MKTTILAVMTGLALVAAGAERKSPEAVDIDALMEATQKAGGGADATNIAWVIPVEYWEVSLRQDASISPAQREELLDVLRGYVLIGVVRARITGFGTFRFLDRDAVENAMTVTFEDAAGKSRELRLEKSPSDELEMILNVIKPILSSSLGKLGANFHLFVCVDRDAGGDRIASPYERGTIRIDLARTPTVAASTFDVEFPLHALHVPRLCAPCRKEMHISWSFCPWCGKRLEGSR